MKRIFISALALLGMGVMANAQEKVTIHNGSESYVTNVEYITFDATDADDAVSVSALQTEITTLTGEKTTLEGQVSTLTSEKAELATAKTTLEGQVSTLTSEKAELATAKTTLEGQVSTLTSEKAELATAKTTLEGQVSTLTSEKTALETKVKSMEYALGERAKVHEYVDLGLTSGTLWATMNVGASSPEDYGDYFAWGETAPKSDYSWSTYFDTNDGGKTFSKYKNIGGKKELDDADDVAVQAWGGAWKMPTKTQQDELCNECYWVWTSSYNGKSVNGYIVYKAKSDSDKGKKIYSGSTPSADYDVATDAHIFLPAAGYRDSGNLGYVGGRGYFGSRSLNTNFSNNAYELYFYSSGVLTSGSNRSYGLSVRPVCPGK
ncbi:MAG: hypothetical protein MJZ01_07395 [Bacteroidales bacterium]|nr:hypothetical protein [Bacteroidales bacterium]